MPRKKLSDNILPRADDPLFTQEGFTFKFCRQRFNNGTKGNRPIGLIIGLGQSTPLFNDPFAKILMHRRTALNLRAWLPCSQEPIAWACQLSPSLPIASTGHPSIASLQSASSSG